MTARSPSYLKQRFETGDIPTGTDYEDVFDSFLPVAASGAQTIDGPLTVGAITTPSIAASAASISGIVSAVGINNNGAFITDILSLNAASTTQASSPSLTGSINWIVSADGNNTAAKLVSAQPGRIQYVVNATTTVIKIFPPSGGNFVTTANNASLNIPAGKGGTVLHGPTGNSYIMIVG